MSKNNSINCPICNSKKGVNILLLDCGNLDNSSLYRYVKINACKECGHIYNPLSLEEIEGLKKYYNEEYGRLNLSSTDKSGDRPGSDNPFTLKRHSQLYGLISPHLPIHPKVLDVGCATGGFLDYLKKQGLNKLYGIDITENYVREAKKKGGYIIKLGTAESIPFDDNSFDLLVLDQVLEHLVEPSKAFKEAKRVLVEGGLLCLGVPDASRYDEIYFFDFYWFLLREHIQHFDIEHLKLLAAREGFGLVTHSQSETPMMSEKMILPNLNVIFRLTNKTDNLEITETCFNLKKNMEKYVKNNFKKMKHKSKIINKIADSKKPLYAWGIGREFLYLYQSVGLKDCNLIGLIDGNPYKQNLFRVEGKKISDISILNEAKSDSAIIITAMAHINSIKTTLKEIGFRGKIVEF